MQQIIDILNAQAKIDDGTPIYEMDFNGMRLSIDADTRQHFATATEAIAEGRALADQILAVPGWVAVSSAELGAVINALPSYSDRDKPQSPEWYGRVGLTLTTDALFEAQREFPFRRVHGISD